jgi:acyl-CoA synthetase (AMP-forming)/AMP-acid ligase II
MAPLLQVDLLRQLAQTFPDGVAWRDLAHDQHLTLADWHAQSNRLARGLGQSGLGPGHRIALAVSDREPLTWLVSYMGIHKAGCVAVPLQTRLGPREFGRILDHAEASLLMADALTLDRLGAVSAQVTNVVTTGPEGAVGHRWSDLLSPDATDLSHQVRPEDLADIMYTSGTTGDPKGVLVRHDGLSTVDRIPATWLGLGFITASPFSTTSGSLLVCGPSRGGLTGLFLSAFDPGQWLRWVSSERPVAAFLVPAMVQLIVAHPDTAAADLSSLAVVNIGSAPIATETLRRFGRLLPAAEVLCGYGMTEFGAVTTMPMGDHGKHLGSVGRPLPGVELRVVDQDGGTASPGTMGEIAIRGQRARRAYLGQVISDPTAASTDWLLSGDLGHLDAEGFLWITGRKKEMVIRGGHNIVPGEVEAELFCHPAVVDAAVAGVAHPVLGEDVAAWVVVTPGADLPLDQLRAFLLDRLADYKVPRRITVVDALPRNEAGKVLKAQLVADIERRIPS